MLSLAACRPEPVGAYLKALGVLRLLSIQRDHAARGWWHGDVFEIETSIDADGLVAFFLQEYRPTPVLSPWNEDAGFKEGNSTATKTLHAVENSDDPRLAPYREAISVVRSVRDQASWQILDKEQQVSLLRNRLPDDALDWLDAAVVLRSDRPAFPALLGSGGNFGRLELSPNFMDRILRVLEPTPKAATRSQEWLRSALFDEGAPQLRTDAIGQFDPGAAGGVRADAVGGGKSMTNPWDFILTIEGSVLWASGVSRRLGGTTSMASVPFTVEPSLVGQASLSVGESAKAELWAPLWDEPLGLAGLRRLFAEGRISWSAGQAKSGLDATRAIFTLGVDAGLSGFVRHLVAERHGQSTLAVPIGRFPVDVRPGVAVQASLDPWVERLRRAASGRSAPVSLVRDAHRVQQAMFDAASGTATDLQALLIAVATTEATLAHSARARAYGPVPPVGWLPAEEWLPALDDGSIEVRLAAAVALARDEAVKDPKLGLVRSIVRPVELRSGKGGDRYAWIDWGPGEPAVGGLGTRQVTDVLADVLVTRSMAERVDRAHDDVGRGVEPWFPAAFDAQPGDAETFASGQVDHARLSDLLSALLLLSPQPSRVRHQWGSDVARRRAVVPAWRLLAPFYSRHRLPLPSDLTRLRPELDWAQRLRRGDVAGVVGEVIVRWAQAGVPTIYNRRAAAVIAEQTSGPQIVAALACGATRADVRQAMDAVSAFDTESSSQGAPA